jgi:hypothetical protein
MDSMEGFAVSGTRPGMRLPWRISGTPSMSFAKSSVGSSANYALLD